MSTNSSSQMPLFDITGASYEKIGRKLDCVHTESAAWRLTSIIVWGFVFSFTIANLVYYSRLIRKPSQAVTQTEATGMFIVNMIIITLAVIFLARSIWKLFSFERRKKAQATIGSWFTEPGFAGKSKSERENIIQQKTENLINMERTRASDNNNVSQNTLNTGTSVPYIQSSRNNLNPTN